MNDQPDLSTLPQRMRYAAGVLREADNRYDPNHPWGWNPHGLEILADKWEAEDRVADEGVGLVKELAQELLAAFGCDPIRARKSTRGWRKGDPA